jgi:hypothetical protein
MCLNETNIKVLKGIHLSDIRFEVLTALHFLTSTLKMEVLRSSETLVTTHKTQVVTT